MTATTTKEIKRTEFAAKEQPLVDAYVKRQVAFCEKQHGGAVVEEVFIGPSRNQFRGTVSEWLVVFIATPNGIHRDGVVLKHFAKQLLKEAGA